MATSNSSPITRNEWLGLAIGAWLISSLLFYLFGWHGPFGRYSLVVLLGIPGYLTYKYFSGKTTSNAIRQEGAVKNRIREICLTAMGAWQNLPLPTLRSTVVHNLIYPLRGIARYRSPKITHSEKHRPPQLDCTNGPSLVKPLQQAPARTTGKLKPVARRRGTGLDVHNRQIAALCTAKSMFGLASDWRMHPGQPRA